MAMNPNQAQAEIQAQAESKRNTEAYYKAHSHAAALDDASAALIAQLEEKDRAEREAQKKQRQAKEDADLAEFLAKNPGYLNPPSSSQPGAGTNKNPEAPKKAPSPEPKKPAPAAVDKELEAVLRASQLEEENRRKKQEEDFAKRMELARQRSLEQQASTQQAQSLQSNGDTVQPVKPIIIHTLEVKMDADAAMARALEEEERRKASALSSARAEQLTQEMLQTERFLAEEQRKKQAADDQALAASHAAEQDQGGDLTGQQLAQFYADQKVRLGKISAELLKGMKLLVQGLLPLKALTGEYQPGKEAPKKAMDAHAYTKDDINKNMPGLINIDDTLSFSDASKNLDTIQAEILKYVKEVNDAKTAAEMEKNINESFRRIRAVSTDPKAIDKETNVCVVPFLSRIWTLACKLGRTRQGKLASIFSDNTSVNDSSKELGGCVPGLIARLFPEYVKFLAVYIDVLPIVETPEMIYMAAFNNGVNGQSSTPKR